MDEFSGDLEDVVDTPSDVGDVSSEISDGQDVDLDSMSLDELYALRDELTEGSDSSPDYSFHWDGTPTHDVEWDGDTDDETGDTPYTRVLKR